MFTPEITPLSDSTDLARHGGKAINLARLIRGGFAVPDGFCLGTDWYAAHAGQGAPVGRRQILDTPMAHELRETLLDAYHHLGGGPVAVRSSATAEDLADASFAGQQDTYLNVSGDDELVEAVQRCWASLWNERAVDYRRRHSVTEAELAVIVQRMVDAQSAGVTFTANPLTGRRGEVVIDAIPGLGEALVSGQVNPDHFVVSGKIADAGEGTCLDTRSLQMVTDTCRQVESHFGAPQDIEWAIDRFGDLWLTQSRAITTLYPEPITPAGSRYTPAQRVLLCASHSWQGIRGPLTPAGISGLGLAAASVAGVGARTHTFRIEGPSYSLPVGSRWFLDVTTAVNDKVGRRVLLGALNLVDARSAQIIERLPRSAPETSSRLATARFLLRLCRRHHIVGTVAGALRNPVAARQRVHAMRDEIDADSARLLDKGDTRAIAAFIDSWVGTIWASVVPLTGLGLAMAAVGARAAGVDTTNPLHVAALRAVPGNVTAQMDVDLDLIASRDEVRAWLDGRDPAEVERLRREGRLPEQLATPLTEFLREYGHRAVGEIDLGTPRWATDATPILANLVTLAREANGPSAAHLHAVAQEAAAAAIDDLAVNSKTPKLVRFAYGRARQLLGMREHSKYLNVRVLAGAHVALAAVGEKLAGTGIVEKADDVFFLHFPEIEKAQVSGQDYADLAASRKDEFLREKRRALVPQVMLGDGTQPVEVIGHTDEGALNGVAGSAGIATGVARVITDPGGATLEPGEILVAPTTDPAWTPLFGGAAAIVVETGGVNSHGAVVAREFGIPAVLGIHNLTSRVKTGDVLEVNGSGGSVRIVPADAQDD